MNANHAKLVAYTEWRTRNLLSTTILPLSRETHVNKSRDNSPRAKITFGH